MNISQRDLSFLADRLRPWMDRWYGSGGISGASVEAHALDGSSHTGLLPWSKVSKADASLEDLPNGMLPWNRIDLAASQLADLEIRPHSQLTDIGPNDHHNAATGGAGISVDAAQVISLASSVAGNGLTFASGVIHAAVSGLGLSVGADAIALTSNSNPGAAASVLATDGSGFLALVRLTLTDRLRASLIDTSSGDLTISPATGITSLGSLHASTRLRSPLVDTAAGSLTVSPAVDLVLSPSSNLVKLAASKSFQSDNYASQTTGMRITHTGEGDFRYLFTDEMHAKSFIADLEQALAGGQIITKSVAVVASAFTAPAAGAAATLRVRDLPSAANMACFVSGDIVRLRTFSRAAGSLSIADCWGVVTDYADGTGANEGTQTWTFTRSAAPNAGAMAAGTVIQPDSLALDYGTTGNGFYEVNAIDGAYGLNSPYAQIVSWTTHPSTGQTVRSRLGNLRGIFGASNEYGLYAGAGTSVNDAYLRISNDQVGMFNLPLRMYSGGIERVHVAAHNDVWIGPSSSDKRFLWDGSTLTINGAINVTGGNAATLDNVTGAQNLVANSSFELDSNGDGLADNFTIYGVTETPTASRVAGSKSTWAQRIAWTGTNTNVKGVRFSTGTRRASTDYVITFWARTNTAVDLSINHNDQPTTKTNLLWPTAGTSWQFYAARLQWSSSNTDNWYLSIAYGAAIANGWVEFDNVQVVESTDIVPWALAPTDKADTSLENSAISTLISGANIRVGSGTKDSTLNGWNIDSTEIVGQAAGVDQVVLNSSGQILAGAGQVGLWSSGIGLSFPTNDTFTSTQRISFLRSTLTGTEQGYIGARTFSSGQDFQLEIVGLGYGSSWGSIKLVGSTTTAGAVSSNAGVVVVQAGNVLVPYRGLIVHDDFATYGTTIAASGSLLTKTLVVTGAVGYDWSNLTPATGWQNVGGGNATLGVKRFGNLVSVKGLVSANTSLVSGSTVYTLASEYRPTATRVFNCCAYIGGAMTTVQVNLQSDGQIRPQSAFSSGQWLSLEIMYFTGG